MIYSYLSPLCDLLGRELRAVVDLPFRSATMGIRKRNKGKIMTQKRFCISILMFFVLFPLFSVKSNNEDGKQLSVTGLAVGFAQGISNTLSYVLYPALKLSKKTDSFLTAAEKSTVVQNFQAQPSEVRSAYYLGYGLAQGLIAFILAEFSSAANHKSGVPHIQYLPLIPATLSSINVLKGFLNCKPHDGKREYTDEPTSNSTTIQRRMSQASR